MKQKIIAGIIALLLTCLIIGVVCSTTYMVAGQTLDNNYTKEELSKEIDELQIIKDNAHTMAESARILGWTDEDKLIKNLQSKWSDADTKQKEYQKQLNEILAEEAKEQKALEEEARKIEEEKWEQKAAEYPVATQIWRYMKSQGWSDYVCAGIMGNLMAEVGGQTLNIRYTLSSSGYYGMCQWNRAYSQVWGAGLETQCDFLRDTIKYEFDTYGFKYQKGFNFNSFLNMTDAQQAALAFAKSYERCGSSSYGVRQQNALKAYEYFVN